QCFRTGARLRSYYPFRQGFALLHPSLAHGLYGHTRGARRIRPRLVRGRPQGRRQDRGQPDLPSQRGGPGPSRSRGAQDDRFDPAPAVSLDRSVFWEPWEGRGLEHLRLGFAEDHIVARGVVLGMAGPSPFELRYKIKCDLGWRTRKLDLELYDLHGCHERHIRTHGDGNWHEAGR